MKISIKSVVINMLVICFYLFQTNTYAALSPIDKHKILSYISHQYKSLERSSIECKSYLHDKIGQRILYFPSGISIPEAARHLKKTCFVSLQYLPQKISQLGQISNKHLSAGVLYLPNSYIVPGGRFNEMYGWDSYFIILGLLQNHEITKAQKMVENFFFEIDHYGAILNANRSYFLTRSQPPFLTSMILEVYKSLQKNNGAAEKWLKKSFPYAEKDFKFWQMAPHLAGNTGLSRYYDVGIGPVPELKGTDDKYYKKILNYFTTNKYVEYISSPLTSNAKIKRLNEKFYRGDRAMRESGLDTSFRFGKYSADTTDYAPVDLNSLLYKAAADLEWMSHKLNQPASEEYYKTQKIKLKKLINIFVASHAMQFAYLDTSTLCAQV